MGLPTLSMDLHAGYRRVLGLADFIDEPENRPRNTAEFLARVQMLVASPDLRRVSGLRAQVGYAEKTAEGPWIAGLASMYAELADLAARGESLGRSPGPSNEDELRDLAEALLAIEQRIPLQWSIAGSLPRLDLSDRVSEYVRSQCARIIRRLMLRSASGLRAADAVLVPGALVRGARSCRRRRHESTATSAGSALTEHGKRLPT